MGRAQTAAAAKGKEIFAYGEILNRPGEGRSLGWYTKHGVAITDSGMGHNIVENGGNGHGSFNGADGNNYEDYRENMVTWAESHDNYMGTQDTHNKSETVINRSYAILASRKDFSTLYCARFEDYENSILGDVACLNGWSYASVGAVNKFHNFFSKSDAAENCFSSGSYTVTERYGSNGTGVVIVGDSGNCSISVPNMANGTYKDAVTGNTFTVSGGVITGTIGDEQVAVVYNNTGSTEGSCSISCATASTFNTATTTATFVIRNAVSSTLTINGASYDITSGAQVTFGYDMAVGDTKTITVTATDKNSTVHTQTYKFTKVAPPVMYTVHFDKPDSWTNVYAYLYPDANSTADKVAMELDSSSNTYYVEYEDTYTYVAFGDGTDATVLIPLTSEDLTYETIAYDGYIYFDNSASWSTVNAYMWVDESTNNAIWPGLAISLDEETGLYRVSPESYVNIIFNNGSAQTEDLAIRKDFSIAYNASSYEGIRVTTGETCEHTYSSPVWTWDGYSAATLKLTCANCGKTITKDATITNEITVEPTTSTTGTRAYTATATFNGNTYTNTKNETLPMVDNTITTVPRVEPSCTANGNILYYIKNGKYYSDSYCTVEISLSDTVIPALGHTHEGNVIVSKSNLTATCSTCGETYTIEMDSTTIYFVNTSDWANVTAYAWKNGGGEGNQNHAWPGIAMTDTGLTYNGHKIYSYKNTEGYTMIIFSNSGNSKTGDLTIPTDANCYIYNDSFNYVFVGE
jgi:ribosomal protein S27E